MLKYSEKGWQIYLMSSFKRKRNSQRATQTTFVDIRSIFPNFLRNFATSKINYPKQIFNKWPEIIGIKFARWTKPISFEKGILKVTVKSSALYSILIKYEKKRLLGRITEQFPKAGVKDVQFYIR